MSEYKSIRGGKVKNYTTDPDNPYAGQVWFNETEGELRVRKNTLTSAWAAGGNLNTGRSILMGSGTQTAALHYGGNPAGAVSTTASYDGTNWAVTSSMGTTRSMGGGCGAGTSTAALASSGCGPGATEEFTGEITTTTARTLTTS